MGWGLLHCDAPHIDGVNLMCNMLEVGCSISQKYFDYRKVGVLSLYEKGALKKCGPKGQRCFDFLPWYSHKDLDKHTYYSIDIKYLIGVINDSLKIKNDIKKIF